MQVGQVLHRDGNGRMRNAQVSDMVGKSTTRTDDQLGGSGASPGLGLPGTLREGDGAWDCWEGRPIMNGAPAWRGKASDTMPSSWVISEFPEKLLAVLKVRDE